MSQSPAPSSAPTRVRPLTVDDIDAVVKLLSVGFPERTPDYWRHAMKCLRDRAVPENYPRFGYGLSVGGELAGVLLLIFSRADDGSIRANVSSWYVDPNYRLFSNMLLAPALKMPDVTFFNISPAPHTLPTIAKQGFLPYAEGVVISLAALGGLRPNARVTRVAPATGAGATLAETHAAIGCVSFDVEYEGKHHAFVFLPSAARSSGIRFVHLVYCEDVAVFAKFAGVLGRRLFLLGYFFVMVDANGPIDGLVGRYFKGKRVKCARGKTPPRLGDLADTEMVLFGP